MSGPSRIKPMWQRQTEVPAPAKRRRLAEPAAVVQDIADLRDKALKMLKNTPAPEGWAVELEEACFARYLLRGTKDESGGRNAPGGGGAASASATSSAVPGAGVATGRAAQGGGGARSASTATPAATASLSMSTSGSAAPAAPSTSSSSRAVPSSSSNGGGTAALLASDIDMDRTDPGPSKEQRDQYRARMRGLASDLRRPGCVERVVALLAPIEHVVKNAGEAPSSSKDLGSSDIAPDDAEDVGSIPQGVLVPEEVGGAAPGAPAPETPAPGSSPSSPAPPSRLPLKTLLPLLEQYSDLLQNPDIKKRRQELEQEQLKQTVLDVDAVFFLEDPHLQCPICAERKDEPDRA